MINSLFLSSSTVEKIAYVGDVPPDRTVAGSLLLHRLFHGLERDRLIVVLGNTLPSEEQYRLPGVSYSFIKYAPTRLLSTRIKYFASTALVLGNRLFVRKIVKFLRESKADALVTVTHGHLWLAACRAANILGIPYHLVCHDDWNTTTPVQLWANSLATRAFGRAYRGAASRLCISPSMNEKYEELFGVSGTLLYPNRGFDSPHPMVRLRSTLSNGFTIGYAGSLEGSDYREQLSCLAKALRKVDGRLLIHTRDCLGSLSELPNVVDGGFVRSSDLAESFATTSDVLFVPMSFDVTHRRTVEISFPSKIADYTAIGLPLLIAAPSYSSAVRWVREHAGSAEVILKSRLDVIEFAVRRLYSSYQLRLDLANNGIVAGNKCFSLMRAQGIFYRALGIGGNKKNST